MFSFCENLTTIYASKNFVTTKVILSGEMFVNCNKLKGSLGTIYNDNNTGIKYAKIDGGTSSPGYFSEISYDDIDISKLTIKNNIVILDINSTKKTITDLIGTEENIQVLRGETQLDNETKLRTTDILKINDVSYPIAILGDIAPDGKITGSDISRGYSAYKQATTLKEEEYIAADVTGDNKITGSDISKLYSMYKKQ